jgi:hypothetical protein
MTAPKNIMKNVANTAQTTALPPLTATVGVPAANKVDVDVDVDAEVVPVPVPVPVVSPDTNVVGEVTSPSATIHPARQTNIQANVLR